MAIRWARKCPRDEQGLSGAEATLRVIEVLRRGPRHQHAIVCRRARTQIPNHIRQVAVWPIPRPWPRAADLSEGAEPLAGFGYAVSKTSLVKPLPRAAQRSRTGHRPRAQERHNACDYQRTNPVRREIRAGPPDRVRRVIDQQHGQNGRSVGNTGDDRMSEDHEDVAAKKRDRRHQRRHRDCTLALATAEEGDCTEHGEQPAGVVEHGGRFGPTEREDPRQLRELGPGEEQLMGIGFAEFEPIADVFGDATRSREGQLIRHKDQCRAQRILQPDLQAWSTKVAARADGGRHGKEREHTEIVAKQDGDSGACRHRRHRSR